MATFKTKAVPISASLLIPIDMMAAGSAVRISPTTFVREDDDVYVGGGMRIPSSSTPAIVGHGLAKVDKSFWPWWVCRAQFELSAATNVNYNSLTDSKLDPDSDDYLYLAGYMERSGGYYSSRYYKVDKNTLSATWSWSLSSYSIYYTQGMTIIPSAGTGKVWVHGVSTYRTDISVLNASTGLTSDYVCGGIANGVDDHLQYWGDPACIVDGIWWIMMTNGGNKVIDRHYQADGQSAMDYFTYSPVKHYSYDKDFINFDSTYLICNQGQGFNGTPQYGGGPVKFQKTNPYTEAWCANFVYPPYNSNSIFQHCCLTSAHDYVISSGYVNATPATGIIVKVATSDGATGFSRTIPPVSYTVDYIYGGHAECIGLCGDEYILMVLPHLVDNNGHIELLSLVDGTTRYTTRYEEIDSGIYGSGGWYKNGAVDLETQDYIFGSMSIKASSHPDMNSALTTAFNKNYGISGTSFTIDFWLKFPTGSDRYSLITSWADDDLKGYEIYYDRLGTGAFSFIYYNTGLADWVEVESNDVTLEDDTWHHIAITKSAAISAMYFFVDGASIGVNTTTTSHSATYANYSITDPAPGCPMKLAVRMNDVGEPDYYLLNAYRVRLNTCTWSADFTRPTNYNDYSPTSCTILLLGDIANLALHYSTDQVSWRQLSPAGPWTYADGAATEGNRIASLLLSDTDSMGKYHESASILDGLSGQYNELDFCIVPTTVATAGQYWFRFVERYVPITPEAGHAYPSLYYIPPEGGTEEPTGAYVFRVMRHMKWFSEDEQYQGFWLGGR